MDISHGDPIMIIVSGKIFASNIQADCGAATQNILLAAESMDIGSCWIGLVAWYFKLEENVKKINVTSGYEVLYGIYLGYKAKENEDAPERNIHVFNWIK